MGLRYLALGDSYTIGEGVAPAERWPDRLAVLLRGHGLALDPPHIVATTGWTVAELQAGIDADAPRGPFDLVSVLAGVNDQYRGRPAAAYAADFAALVERAVAFAGGRPARVLVLTIPDWGVTPFAAAQGRAPATIATELDAYNALAAAQAAQAGTRLVDIAPVARQRGAEGAMLAGDGLHPSGAMHALWAALALPHARAALG